MWRLGVWNGWLVSFLWHTCIRKIKKTLAYLILCLRFIIKFREKKSIYDTKWCLRESGVRQVEVGLRDAAGHYEHNNPDSHWDTERRRRWRKNEGWRKETRGIVSRIMMGQLRTPADRSLYFRPFQCSMGLSLSPVEIRTAHTHIHTHWNISYIHKLARWSYVLACHKVLHVMWN